MKKFRITNYFLIFFIISLFLMILSGCGSNEAKENHSQTPSRKSPKGDSLKNSMNNTRRLAAMTPVEITRVVRGNIANYLLFSSAVETEHTSDIFPKVSGEIIAIYKDEGQHVKKDEVIMKIDDREYKIQAERARVNYEQLKSELERLRKLKEKDLVSEEEFDKAKFSVEQAKLDWDLARLNLEYTNIRAPFDGVVAERFVNVGDRVNSSSKLFTITNLNEKIVKIYVPQNDIVHVFKGQKAIITTDILPEKEFEGWVKRISPVIDPSSGTFKVTVGVKDPSNLIHPGIFVNVSLIVNYHQNTLLIPKTSLVYESEKAFLYIIKNGKARKIELKRGYEDAQKVEVLAGIEEGDSVIVVGQNALKDNVPVKVVKIRTFSWQNANNSPVSEIKNRQVN